MSFQKTLDAKFRYGHGSAVNLESNDGHSFIADSFYLAQSSKFFADLFQTASRDGEPIKLDFPGSTISIYMDFIHTFQAWSLSMNLETAKSALALGDFVICDSFAKCARDMVYLIAKEQPLGVLLVAPERDDVLMARHALSHASPAQLYEHFKFTTEGASPLQDILDYLA